MQFIDDFVNCIAENYERISEICEKSGRELHIFANAVMIFLECIAEICQRIAEYCERIAVKIDFSSKVAWAMFLVIRSQNSVIR